MLSSQSIRQIIDLLRVDDVSVAQSELWDRYFADLVRRVAQRLGNRYCAAVDAEDVALSTMDSFFRGIRVGQFPDLRNHDQLWNLLLTIAYRKVSKHQRRENCAKRGGGTVRNEASLALFDSETTPPTFEIADGPTEEEIVAAAAEMTEDLPDEVLRTIAVRRLQGYTDKEIAQQLGVTERTIIRKRQRIQAIWQSSGDD